ncbi:hypothetical protein PV327_010060 [Microctonus hyperodae]|uniref:Secreted protein n=1 Tax=Microctonus hyperodae TaxID=165561 RepID=A0AA39KGD7_MICHY|nr:hypothetical protein PV327_010060 [Microctonus hyperodae]
MTWKRATCANFLVAIGVFLPKSGAESITAVLKTGIMPDKTTLEVIKEQRKKQQHMDIVDQMNPPNRYHMKSLVRR